MESNTPPGEIGELVVASPYVALGLWVDGRCAAGASIEATAAPLVRLFRTGDLVHQRPGRACWSGSAARTGRSRFGAPASKLDGVRAVLRQHPLVRDVAVWCGLRTNKSRIKKDERKCPWRGEPRRLCEPSRWGACAEDARSNLKSSTRSVPPHAARTTLSATTFLGYPVLSRTCARSWLWTRSTPKTNAPMSPL